MDELFQSELLKAILCGQFGDYGMTPGQGRGGGFGHRGNGNGWHQGPRGDMWLGTHALEPIITENWVVE